MSVRLVLIGWLAIFGLCVTACAVRMGAGGASPPPATAAQAQGAPAATATGAQPTAQAGQP